MRFSGGGGEVRFLFDSTALCVTGGVWRCCVVTQGSAARCSARYSAVCQPDFRYRDCCQGSLLFDLNLTAPRIRAAHSMGLFGLPAHHQDPVDRALIAIAIGDGVPTVARDRAFKKHKGLRTIW